MGISLTRRDFVRASGAGIAATILSAPGLALGADKKAANRPPNFIVILGDDLSAKELSCYGSANIRTPNLDALARTGVMFKTCYATPLCHPTRFMLMTGQYAHHNGVYNFPNRPGGPKAGSPADDIGASHVTFAEVVKPRGYATALTGKWQLTGEHPTLIHDAGFDEYCMWAYTHNLPASVKHTGAFEGPNKPSRYWNPSIVKNGQYVPTKADDYGPDIFNDFAIDFIKRKKDQPFFIYYTSVLTHGPHYSTPDTTKSEQDKKKNSKDNFKGVVEYLDKLIGRLVKALDETGVRDNTIVFFTGDNGTGGEGKGQANEKGALVPLIVNCPGIVKPSPAPREELTDLTDVLPTMAEFAGADLPKNRPVDGHSLAPLLRGGKDFVEREWIYSYLGDRRILRDKRWLLENNTPANPGSFLDCGDSRDGIGYKDVTASKDPEVLAARKRFEEILKDKPVPKVEGEGRPKDKGKAKGGKKANKAKKAENGGETEE